MLKDRFARTTVMLGALLIVAVVATPFLQSIAWMTVLASAPPYLVLCLLFLGKDPSLSLLKNVTRYLVYIATPSLVMYFVFIRAVGDLIPWFAIAGLLIVGFGSVVGAVLITLIARRIADRASVLSG